MSLMKKVGFDIEKFTGLIVDTSKDKLFDLVEASNTLVFSLVSVNGGWKIPFGYFLTNGMNTDQIDNFIKQALTLLHDTGVQVVALTFDGTSANLSTCRKLSNDANKHFQSGFEHMKR